MTSSGPECIRGRRRIRIANGILMYVDSMFTGRKVLKVVLDLDSVALGTKHGGAHASPFGILQCNRLAGSLSLGFWHRQAESYYYHGPRQQQLLLHPVLSSMILAGTESLAQRAVPAFFYEG
jgi:hypothetical protein